jgi:hemolysin activation/secretion protein
MGRSKTVVSLQTAMASLLLCIPPASHPQSSAGNPLDALPALPSPPAQAQVPITIESPSSFARDLQSRVVSVSRVDVLGSTAIDFEQITALLKPIAGRQVTLGQLNEAAQGIGALYLERGYALSFAYLPPQEFTNGVVQINVVEGFIQTLELEGSLGKSERLIRELAEPITQERPLTTETFQRQTQLMARLPGIEIAATANPPTTTDGATALIIRSRHKPVTLSLGGEVRKPTPRGIGTVTLNDPLWEGSQLQLSMLLKDFDRERFLAASYTQVLNARGTTARVNFTDYRSRNDPLSRQPGIDDETRQRKLDVGITHPWVISATEQLSTTVGIYGVQYGKEYWIQSSELSITDEEAIRAMYAQLNWSRHSATVAQSASVLLAKGVNALGAGLHRSNSAGLPMETNPVKVDFFRMTLDYSHRHRFANRWGAAFSVGGQYSPDIVPAPERVSFGGTRFGRGYSAGEFAGDSGLGASAELNYQFVADTPWLKSVEPYVLYEYAKTHQHLEGAPTTTLRSGTIGLRVSDSRYYLLDVGVSKPFGVRSVYNPERKLRYGLMLTYNLDM